jgi:hypothetical protein
MPGVLSFCLNYTPGIGEITVNHLLKTSVADKVNGFFAIRLKPFTWF